MKRAVDATTTVIIMGSLNADTSFGPNKSCDSTGGGPGCEETPICTLEAIQLSDGNAPVVMGAYELLCFVSSSLSLVFANASRKDRLGDGIEGLL